MKLLIVTKTIDVNDSFEGYFVKWVELLAKEYKRIHIICLKEGLHELPENVKVHSLGYGKNVSHMGRLLHFYYYILRYYFGYSSVFVHKKPGYAVWGWPFWKLARKKIVLWHAGTHVPLTLRLGQSFADLVCLESSEDSPLEGKNIVVMGHAVDIDAFSIPRAPLAEFKRLVVVGRITRSKNLHVLIEAVSRLPLRGVPYRLTLVGDTITRDDERYRDELMDRTAELQIADFVGFSGAKEYAQIPRLLAASDIFLHAKDSGSIGATLLEAMAARCMVITANPAARPILERVDRRFAVREADPELFADAIQAIDLMDDKDRTVFAERLHQVAAGTYSLEKMIERLVRVLRK